MNKRGFRAWLDRYGEAWQSLEPDRAAELCTRGASYHRTPFHPPLAAREAISAAWARALSNRRDVPMQSTIIGPERHAGIARWRTGFRRPATDRRIIVDGVLIAEFSTRSGACRRMREGWHSTDRDAGRTNP